MKYFLLSSRITHFISVVYRWWIKIAKHPHSYSHPCSLKHSDTESDTYTYICIHTHTHTCTTHTCPCGIERHSLSILLRHVWFKSLTHVFFFVGSVVSSQQNTWAFHPPLITCSSFLSLKSNSLSTLLVYHWLFFLLLSMFYKSCQESINHSVVSWCTSILVLSRCKTWTSSFLFHKYAVFLSTLTHSLAYSSDGE